MVNPDTHVRVCIDADTRRRATSALEAMGLSMSDAISLFVSRIAEDQKLPFEAAIPNEVTRKAMEELEQGKGKCFDTVEALMIDLESDD